MEEKNWTSRITQAEASWNKVKEEYDDARDYYEDEQAPSDVPSNKDYIQENIITDTIDRSVGSLLSGSVKPVLIGGGEMAEAANHLHDDILEANNFKELILPVEANKFYLEGLGGFKFVDNPYREDRYGIGFPEIYGIAQGRLLLDPNSITGMHDDDLFRIHKERRLKSYALEKWGRNENGRKNKLWDEIEGSVDESSSSDTEEFVEVYEIEYWKHKFSEFTDPETGKTVRRERKVYYITVYVNKTVEVVKPTPTGYPCFRIIPLIHTPRKNKEDFGCYPMGLYKKLAQQQDQLNITASVVLDVIKASIKNLKVAKGVKPDELTEFKRQAAKTDGVVGFSNPNVKVDEFKGSEISPALLQWHQWQRQSFDDIKGSSNQAQQFQSAASGQLSGKAISNLQFAGVLPEYSKKVNIEYALKNLSLCIFHYIKTKMRQPFSITREIEGKEQTIAFNQIGDPSNQLSELGFTDVKLQVDLNVQQREEMEMNKALVLAGMQKISDQDLLLALYPNSWREKLDRLMKQNQAMGLVQEMVEVGGEDFVNFMAQEIQQYKGTFENGQLKEQ